MRTFEVWAPRATRVELVLDGARRPMARRDGGWWFAEAEARAGSRYGFSLDGGRMLADPRSPRQPDGVEGPSAVVDHEDFVWHDDGWRGERRPGWVLYELHIGTFSSSGTFDGAIDRLADLVDLGVDAVELLPVASGPGRWGWGYDGVGLYSVSEPYGGPDGLKRFVDACHQLGLGVVLDVVYNHLGPAGNHLAEFGPYFTDRHQTPWGDAVNFDGEGSAEVRRFVVDNALQWLRDYHVDGLRLDAVHAIIDDSPRHLLAELAEAVARLGEEVGRDLFLIAESDENDATIVQAAPGGHGLDGVWSDDWHHALHTVLTGETDGYYADYGGLDHLAKALRQAWVYDGGWSAYRDRHHGTSPAGIPADRLVVATQNHDQIGNRAAGERLSMLVDPARLRAAAALLLTSPFVPMLFQGEEWGAGTPFLYFTDHDDPALAAAIRDGRRAEFAAFGWDSASVPDPQAEATFRRSVLDWSERDRSPHAELLAWYRWLIDLRHLEPDLHDPDVPAEVEIDGQVLQVRRGRVTVEVDLATGDVVVTPSNGAPRPDDDPLAMWGRR